MTVVMRVSGIALLVGGVILFIQGVWRSEHPYYFTVLGIWMALSGGLVAHRNFGGLWAFAVALFYALAWTMLSFGLAFRPLMDHVAPFVLIGAHLLILRTFSGFQITKDAVPPLAWPFAAPTLAILLCLAMASTGIAFYHT